MQRPFLLLLLTFAFSGVFGQAFDVSGQLIDGNEAYPLIGGYVILEQKGEATKWKTVTDYNGNFSLLQIKPGTYQMVMSYLGYAALTQELTVVDKNLELGKIQLSQGVELAQIEVVEKVIPVRQKGDTTLLNAAAYKTLPDATAEELLQKMPTLAISDGEVQAQGEKVKKVIVDGKPFFGDDALATLRNLPAEIIERIEIFDEQSEEARASGFDDGNTAKTINIVTKKDMRNGIFGRLFAGYGSMSRYDAGGNVNSFNGSRRLSVVGMANNVNRQNFSPEDLNANGPAKRQKTSTSRDFLVKGQSGIVTTEAFGVNIVDEWGENIKVTGSYFYNNTEGTTRKVLDRQFFDIEGAGENYQESSYVQSDNANHRFNGRINWRIDGKNSILWRPKVSWRGSQGESNSFGTTLLNGVPIDTSQSIFSANSQALNLNNSLLWKHKFNKSKRTFTVNLTQSTTPNRGDNQLLFSEVSNGTILREIDQQAQLDKRRNGGAVNLQYTEPISKRSSLLLLSKTSIREDRSEQLAYAPDPTTSDYDDLITDQSGLLSNDYLSQEIGTGVNYSKKGVRLTARANVQYAHLMNSQEVPPLPTRERTFWSILPSFSLRWKQASSGNLNLVYRSSTRLPSAEQLQELVNSTNPRLLRTGNPNLRQEVRHNMYLRFNNTNATAGRVFYTLLGGGVTQHNIANGVFTSESDLGQAFGISTGTRISQPINLNGSWNLRALTTLGFPVALIGSNVNLDFSVTTRRQPGLVNGQKNDIQNSSSGAGITLSSNISNKVDFSLASRGKLNWVTNALQPAGNNQFFQQTTRFNLNWIVGPGIVFRTNISHRIYRGLAAELNQDFVLWNLSLGKKMLKNNRGEVSLSVFDLLDQNISHRRHVLANFTEDVSTDVLTRYVKLGFRYDLRKFGP